MTNKKEKTNENMFLFAPKDSFFLLIFPWTNSGTSWCSLAAASLQTKQNATRNAWMYHRFTFPRDSVASLYCMSWLHLETSSGIHTLHPLWTWYTNAQRVCHSMFNPSSVILSISIYIFLSFFDDTLCYFSCFLDWVCFSCMPACFLPPRYTQTIAFMSTVSCTEGLCSTYSVLSVKRHNNDQ